jgi:hypothetical protein
MSVAARVLEHPSRASPHEVKSCMSDALILIVPSGTSLQAFQVRNLMRSQPATVRIYLLSTAATRAVNAALSTASFTGMREYRGVATGVDVYRVD